MAHAEVEGGQPEGLLPSHGRDPRFHRWVEDLYEHHWVNAKPSSSTLLTPDT